MILSSRQDRQGRPATNTGAVAEIRPTTLTQIVQVSHQVWGVHSGVPLGLQLGCRRNGGKPGEAAGLLPTLAKVRCSRPFTTVWTPMGLTLPKPATSPLTAIISCSYSVATTSSSCET